MAGAGPLDLVRDSFRLSHGQLTRARERLRAEAPGGSKFLIASLEILGEYRAPWERDDRRLRLLDLLTRVNADVAQWPKLADPAVKDRVRALIAPLLTQVAANRGRPWMHVEEVTRFLTHFDLWAVEHVPFLGEEIARKTRRTPQLTGRLIALFPSAPDEARAEVARLVDGVPYPRFTLAALLWLHGPALGIKPTLASWAKWELSGRGFALPEPLRGQLRELGARFEAELGRRARDAPDVREALTHLPDEELALGGLGADDRARLTEAVTRVLTSPCTDTLASEISP